MLRLVKVKTCNLVVILTICLASCKDKQELGFLGNIEVGKYEITQYREYPNGFKDTLIYEAYGPWYQRGGGRYYFSVDTMTTYRKSWEIMENRSTFLSYSSANDEIRYYQSSVDSYTGSNIIINYNYYVGGLGVVSDSASGVITIKRIPQ